MTKIEKKKNLVFLIPGHIIFQLRKRTEDSKRRQKQRSVSHEDLRAHPSDQRHTNLEMLPYLIEMNVRGMALSYLHKQQQ